jgi:hypothetical protein
MADTNDIVLIHIEDTPITFARIESILPDVKKDWYNVRLLMLQVPLQVVTWILKNDYINGYEFFMNDKKMRLEVVESPIQDLPSIGPKLKKKRKTPQEKSSPKDKGKGSHGQIISLADFKKNSPKDDDYEPESG